MGTTPIFGFPYPDPSDLVANYPALGQDLAEDVETAITTRKILQVVSTFKSNRFTTTSLTFVDVTDLSVSITPTSSSNKILVFASLNGFGSTTATRTIAIDLVRSSTAIMQSTGSTFSNQSLSQYGADAAEASNATLVFLDSPATTSATTYKIQMKINAAGTAVIGSGTLDGAWGSACSITVMEVAA